MNPVTKEKKKYGADGIDTTLTVPFFKDPIKLSISGLAVIGTIIIAVWAWKKYKIAKKG